MLNQGHWVFIQLYWALYYRPCIIRQLSSHAERPLVFYMFAKSVQLDSFKFIMNIVPKSDDILMMTNNIFT